MDNQERAKDQERLYKEVYRVCIVGPGARGRQDREGMKLYVTQWELS